MHYLDKQVLQKVRQSLKDSGDIRMFERLAEVTEPGNIKVLLETFMFFSKIKRDYFALKNC